MRIRPFQLERFFARHEFSAPYLLSASDCETWTVEELLGFASPESMALWQELRLGYTESQGHPLLREEAAQLYDSAGPDQVLVAAPEEAIFILMHALLEPGDHAVVLTPAYQSLYEVARSAGCEVTEAPLRPEPGAWHMDLDRMRRAITPRTRLLVVNFPHNPTGYLPTRGEFDAVVAMARGHGIHLLGDEMYRLLERDPARRLPAACDAYEKGISLSGLSKSFGLPGLRTGWLATRDAEALARCQVIKDYTSICHSAPSEILAIIALRAREAIVGRSRGILDANLAAAAAFFAAHSGRFTWIAPQAGPVAFPIWNGPGTADEFCERILRDRDVVLVPGSLFDFPGNHFRLGLGRRNFQAGLDRMDDFMRGWRSPPGTRPEPR